MSRNPMHKIFPVSLNFSAKFALIAVSGMAFFTMPEWSTTQVHAQQLRKAAHDYLSGSVTYSPQDPWVRSNAFHRHTGHYGLFYNCDSEECKRYSPYIQWKTNYQPLWPNTRGFVDGTVRDLDRVRQRIDDGSCNERQLPGNHTTNYKFRRAAEFLAADQVRPEARTQDRPTDLPGSSYR